MDNPLLSGLSFDLDLDTTTNTNSPPQMPELGVSSLKDQILTFYEARFWLSSELPSPLEVRNRFSLTEREFETFYEELIEPLKNRLGIVLPSLTNFSHPPVKISSSENELDPVFAMACSVICDTVDKRTTSAKLKALGISSKQWQAQLKIPMHREYFEKRLADSFNNVEISAKLALGKNVEAGDLQSIKYYHEYTGKYRPQNDTSLNLVFLMGRMMEILSKFLSPEQLSQIADELDTVLDVKEIENGN